MDQPLAHPRYEHKYKISEPLAADIRRTVDVHLQPDQHSLDGEYTVNSLYFDTPDDADAHETDEGIVLRSKVRLRCYSRRPRPPFFLELKQRFGSSIYKTRAAIEPEDAALIVRGMAPVAAYRTRKSAEAVDTIREVIDRRQMEPRVWVKYTREAWTSCWGDGARMTVDRALETQTAGARSDWEPSSSGWCFADFDDRPVLELKFLGAAPHWMQRLAEKFQLDRVSCSKYGICHSSILGPSGLHRPAEAS